MKGKVTSRAYEQLTPQEIRDLKLVFDVFDTDKSGLVAIGNVHIVPEFIHSTPPPPKINQFTDL